MALLGVCAAGVLYEPAFTVIATWFRHNRGTAMAVVTFVAGFASTIFVPLTDALLVAYGWRQAVLILGIILGATTIPLHALVLRRQPADLGLLPDGESQEMTAEGENSLELRQVLRSRFFWILTFGFPVFVSEPVRHPIPHHSPVNQCRHSSQQRRISQWRYRRDAGARTHVFCAHRAARFQQDHGHWRLRPGDGFSHYFDAGHQSYLDIALRGPVWDGDRHALR